MRPEWHLQTVLPSLLLTLPCVTLSCSVFIFNHVLCQSNHMERVALMPDQQPPLSVAQPQDIAYLTYPSPSNVDRTLNEIETLCPLDNGRRLGTSVHPLGPIYELPT
ncbi:hypothetical protein BDV10DRAFT_97830 [Aspergillus recurvatus]